MLNILKKYTGLFPLSVLRADASYTIEAAAVMPLVLLILASMIACGFAMHDTVVTNFTVNEVAELYGHLPEGSDMEELSEYGNERLTALLSDTEYTINIESYKDGSKTTVTGDGTSRYHTDSGFHPETLMRKITVIEEVMN